ncbi:hypothetical protein ATO6_09790 [Oceanicola sp. 22II-s10i]|nr:hypothetical protein ATO6_09790 [Oceanicola sp. 22II-s10i]
MISVDNPPVNILSAQMRQALFAALGQADGDPAVRAVVLGTAAGGFPAQVNPREYDTGLADPAPRALADRIEGMGKPVVALISGHVAGAGAELALACHARVAVSGSEIALREALIGLCPSAGATQRLPRLVGAGPAVDMLIGGRVHAVDSDTAEGLFDRILPAEMAEAAAHALASELAQGDDWVRTCDRTDGFGDLSAYQAVLTARRKLVPPGGGAAERAILQALEAAPLFPYASGAALEADLFDELLTSERSRGLRHALVAETRVNSGISGPQVSRVGLRGTGLGSARLVAQLVQSGAGVILFEPDAAVRSRFCEVVRDTIAQRPAVPGADPDRAMQNLAASGDEAALREAEVLFDLSADAEDTKRAALAALSGLAGEGAVVLSTTRHLDVAALAPEALAPRVLGLHLPSRPWPVHLAELAVRDDTERAAGQRARQMMAQIGRFAIRTKPSDGMVGMAMAGALFDAADELVRLGAEPEAIDAALKRRGMGRGVYRLLGDMDADAHAARQDRRGRQDGLSSLIARAGLKPGQGADHETEAAALASLVTEARGGEAPVGHPWSGEEIWTSILAAMVNEGARLLDAKVAARPLAIDVAMVHGYMFPRTLGGPMNAADMMGLFTLVRAMKALAPVAPDLWSPHPLVVQLQKDGRSFADLNG